MVGSQAAAGMASGEAVAKRSDRFRRFSFAVALLGPTLLAACSTPSPPQVAVPSEPEPSIAVAEPPAPLVAPAASRVLELDKLTGLGAAELVAMLGQPDFRRSDPPAELWQYRSADCVLDVFLYGAAGAYRVVHSETHDRHAVPPSLRPCSAAGAFADRDRQSRL